MRKKKESICRSALFSLIEATKGTLPWKGQPRTETQASKTKHLEKDFSKNNELFKVSLSGREGRLQGLPDSFFEMARHLKTLTYQDKPDYKLISDKVGADLKQLKVNEERRSEV